MKVIDILNKIANWEKVRFKILDNDEIRDEIFEVENGQLRNSTCGKWLETKLNNDTWESISSYFLNEEVELIEEEKKIPKKLYLYEETQNIIRENNYKLVYHDIHKCIVSLECKYNQLIDYLKSKGE